MVLDALVYPRGERATTLPQNRREQRQHGQHPSAGAEGRLGSPFSSSQALTLVIISVCRALSLRCLSISPPPLTASQPHAPPVSLASQFHRTPPPLNAALSSVRLRVLPSPRSPFPACLSPLLFFALLDSLFLWLLTRLASLARVSALKIASLSLRTVSFLVPYSQCSVEEGERGACPLPLQPSFMALLRAPCGVMPALVAPSSNVAFSSCSSSKSQFLVPVIRSSGCRKRLSVSVASPTQMSISSSPGDRDAKYGLISADSSGIGSKGKDDVSDDNFLALASSEAFATAPAKSSEQEEFAKEWAHKPRRVVLFVEPSPFSYISGYKNRYQNFIRYLRELGDEVLVVTTHHGAPQEFFGARVVPSWSFGLPWYKAVPLSLALSPRIYKEVKNFKPDIIHATSPGIMVFGALIISKLVGVPMVMAYHTHVPMYIPKYTFAWLVKPMWLVIKILHRAADMTLVMSVALGKELRAAGASTAEQIRIWRRGVDSDSFHPRFRNAEMRDKITDGNPDIPTIVHVGRLGVEKNLDFLVQVLERIPEARLVFVGDGPERPNLQKIFEGKNVHFTGMLTGEALSQAYASGDVFITPSETETLGFVVLEAMASGIPVVCARAGGIPDIVNQDGVTGLLYTPGDVEDCVGKLKALLNSPDLRDRIGRAGRREVEKFDWRASTRQVRDEEYSAAIWFWRRRKQQLANRFSGWFKRPQPQAS